MLALSWEKRGHGDDRWADWFDGRRPSVDEDDGAADLFEHFGGDAAEEEVVQP